MAIKLLGETLDIHGGGLDLQFPHHENELAQSESRAPASRSRSSGCTTACLKMGTAKMAGSVGNVVNIADLLKHYTAETVRFSCSQTHYRSRSSTARSDWMKLQRSLESFYRFFETVGTNHGTSFYSTPARQSGRADLGMPAGHGRGLLDGPGRSRSGNEFSRCMDDDFNTGGAVGVLFETLSKANSTY